MGWFFAVLFALLFSGSTFLLVRATRRLLEFDRLFEAIVDPMQAYADTLRRITTAEGILHDHPEVIAFHKANMEILFHMDRAIASIRSGRPEKKRPKNLPRPEVV